MAVELGVRPKSIDSVVPAYLAGQNFTGQMSLLREKAQR